MVGRSNSITEVETMKKQIITVFGKDYYLLGADASGTKYYLQKAKFDCGWYWGGGYVETFTNNRNPEKSRDISSHQHFDSLIFNRKKNGFDNFREIFVNNPFTDKEIWTICELMKTFYIMREYSDCIYRGGAHYTSNPAKDTIKNDNEYKRINEIVIPELWEKLHSILGGAENA